MNFCACMGPIGNDPECPCRMRVKGLIPTEIWTPEAKAQLKDALNEIFEIEQRQQFKFQRFGLIDNER